MFRPLRSGIALVVRHCLRAFSLFVFPLIFLGRLGACLRNLFTIISLVFGALSRFMMPKTPRAVSSAPSTISTLLVSEILGSVSAPVSSSASVSFSSVQPARSATREPLTEGQSLRERELFEIFSRFLVWEKTTHPPSSGVSPFSAESARPVYTLAPSVLPSSVKPPTPGL